MAIPSTIRRGIAAFAAVVALGATAPAQSTSLVVSGFAAPGSPLSMTISLAPPPIFNPVSAGGFNAVFGGFLPLQIWCYDLYHSFGFGNSMDYSASLLTTTGNLSKLFTEVNSSIRVSSATNSAAFQLAIWEILYDPTSLDVTSGAFSATGDAGAISQANTWLAGLASTNALTSVFFLSSNEHPQTQNFITDILIPTTLITVPEPASLPLLGLGLVAMFFATRRRSGARTH